MVLDIRLFLENLFCVVHQLGLYTAKLRFPVSWVDKALNHFVILVTVWINASLCCGCDGIVVTCYVVIGENTLFGELVDFLSWRQVCRVADLNAVPIFRIAFEDERSFKPKIDSNQLAVEQVINDVSDPLTIP
jgi:hypothetical protein